LNCWKQLAKYFADMHCQLMTQQRIRQYMRVDRGGKSRANHEAALVSNLLYTAVDYGYVPANPFVKLKWIKRKARQVLPVTEEMPKFLNWLRGRGPQASVMAAMAEFAARAGSRRSEFLNATVFAISGSEVRLRRGKQRDGKEIIDVIEMSPEGIAAVAAVRRDGCEYLFPNRLGRPYTDSGFKSMWSKYMGRAMGEGVVSVRFTFHDLRAYYTSTHKRTLGLLPDIHSNPATTAAVYDRNKEVRRRGM
jgi:integrase